MAGKSSGRLGVVVASLILVGGVVYLVKGQGPGPGSGQTPTTLQLVAGSPNVTTGQTDSLSAMLTDQSGLPIANYPVTFTDQTSNRVIATVNTNASGTATSSDSWAVAGVYSIIASV